MVRRVSMAHALLVAAALAPAPSGAQHLVVECGDGLRLVGDECRRMVERSDSMQHAEIGLRVMVGGRPAPGAVVWFDATAGTLVRDSTRTDSAGYARTVWTRSAGSDPVVVAAHVWTGGASGVRTIRLEPAALPAPKGLVFDIYAGADQSWFEGTQLRRPIDIRIREAQGKLRGEIDDPATCATQRVVFTRYTGSGVVAPDTSIAEVFPMADGGSGCFAWTNWTLPDGPGTREIRATLLPGPGYRSLTPPEGIQATARARPRFVMGLVHAQKRAYVGLKAGASTSIQVERVLGDGRTLKYDSAVVSPQSIDSISGESSTSAAAGLSFALPFARLGRADRLSVTGAVDLGNVRDDWFLGISVLRLFGTSAEALAVDLHLLAHFGRKTELADPTACALLNACATERDRQFEGWAVMVSADATSVIAELVKKLGG